ncbi:MAG: hypothetical protein ACF8QF_01190 [Phycisphaerales bacterium]
MKPVLDWVKSNLVVVICVAVVIISLPVALFFSMGMNKKLVERVQAQVGADERELQGLDVNYSAESLDPATPAVDFRRAPNEATTQALKAFMDRVEEASAEVVEAAVAINSEGKDLLMEGFFPQPERNALAMRQRWGELWVPAHRRLIDEAEAGAPLPNDQVASEVRREYERRVDSLVSTRADKQLTPDEVAQLRAQMTQVRLDIYKRRAADLTAYASPGVFAYVEAPDPTQPVSLERAWDMQHRYWIHEDILQAVLAANTDPVSGWRQRVPEGVVKRIESIAVLPWYFESFAAAGPAPSPAAPIQPDYEVSLTGRTSWPGQPNGLYDARFADVSMLVSSARLPQLIEAISSTNLMTVVSLNLSAVDMKQDLEAGYFYGDDHVVRATMRIETLWLRPWMEPLMPDGVKQALGVPMPAPTGETTDADQY